ncbi:Protein Shroom2 [Dissostichus eleginoides]|uniref:Protein Shroom2 n=1 Tax=Dissostichus eleginoides TaxID=100907 RepID=A0AAD9FE50_DISEL|nr:Protein Shroom2 [Dissostichus eleginoides]
MIALLPMCSAWFAASVRSVCCAESAGKPPGFLDSWSQYIIYSTILNSGPAVAQFPKSGHNRNRTLMSGNGGFAGFCCVMLILSGDIHLNPGPGHVQQTHTDGAPLSFIHCEQVAGANHFVPRSVSVAMTGVASCGCGAAAVIGDPSISWTRATQSCALSGETPHLTCGPRLRINDTPVPVPPVQGDLYDTIRQATQQ